MSKRCASLDQELQRIKAIDRDEKEAQDALHAENQRSNREQQRIPAMIEAMRRCPSPLGDETADGAWLDRMAALLAALKVAGKPDLLKQLPSRGNARRFTHRCVELLTAGEGGQALALLNDIGAGKLDAELACERNKDLPDDLCRLLDLAIPQPHERHRPEAVNDDGPDPADLLSETQQNILRALRLLKGYAFKSRESAVKVARKVDPAANANSYKKPIASLVRDGLVQSKKGPGGGIWLTAKGKSLAEKLASPPRE